MRFRLSSVLSPSSPFREANWADVPKAQASPRKRAAFRAISALHPDIGISSDSERQTRSSPSLLNGADVEQARQLIHFGNPGHDIVPYGERPMLQNPKRVGILSIIAAMLAPS